jgi:hypothetical protein
MLGFRPQGFVSFNLVLSRFVSHFRPFFQEPILKCPVQPMCGETKGDKIMRNETFAERLLGRIYIDLAYALQRSGDIRQPERRQLHRRQGD